MVTDFEYTAKPGTMDDLYWLLMRLREKHAEVEREGTGALAIVRAKIAAVEKTLELLGYGEAISG